MESFAEYKKFFDFSIQDILNDIMLDLSSSIIEINQVDQLDFGIDAKGQVIKTLKAQGSNVYANYTIAKRRDKNLQTDNVDLKNTGSFWNTFKVVKISGGWNVDANFNIHGEDIRANFNSDYDFTGLTPENLEDFVLSEVLPELEKRIKIKLKI